MSRICSQCQTWTSRDDFSNNQWLKGNDSRCRGCVNVPGFSCQECNRVFGSSNQLNMHMQTHRPRDIACPICHQGRFRSGANAVQHVESGYCTGCRGEDSAREQIYNYASRQSAMQPYINSAPLLTYGGYNQNAVPDLPYHCRPCNRQFRNLSQLLQHNDNKHGTQPLRLQY